VLRAASLLAGVGVTAAGAASSGVGSAILAAANIAAAHAAAEGLTAVVWVAHGAASVAAASVDAAHAPAAGLADASWAALGAGATANASCLLFSICCSRLLLSCSFLFSFGGRFLPCLRVPGKLEGDTVAAADVELLLQQKLSSSSLSNVARMSRAHLPSILQPLYSVRRCTRVGEGLCPAAGGELLALPAGGRWPPSPPLQPMRGP
jgi:hypothetical protein